MDRELLIELGCEEIPASWLPPLTAQIGDAAAARMKELRLQIEAPVETFSTPRRLAIRIARPLGSPVVRCVLGNGEDRKAEGGIERPLQRAPRRQAVLLDACGGAVHDRLRARRRSRHSSRR